MSKSELPKFWQNREISWFSAHFKTPKTFFNKDPKIWNNSSALNLLYYFKLHEYLKRLIVNQKDQKLRKTAKLSIFDTLYKRYFSFFWEKCEHFRILFAGTNLVNFRLKTLAGYGKEKAGKRSKIYLQRSKN